MLVELINERTKKRYTIQQTSLLIVKWKKRQQQQINEEKNIVNQTKSVGKSEE